MDRNSGTLKQKVEEVLQALLTPEDTTPPLTNAQLAELNQIEMNEDFEADG